jgi:hypothetical protein
MYVIRLSNISIKMNFKQIARVELKCIQYSEGNYILCMTSRYFCPSFSNVTLLFDHFQCHCTIVQQRFFIWRNVDRKD